MRIKKTMTKKSGMKKRAVAGGMAALVFAGSVMTGMCGADTVYAAQTDDDEKEEVVYVSTDEYGNVQSINVVNIFSGGDITDYGSYTAVKILNTTDELAYTDDKVQFSSTAARVYYQGTMEQGTELPWNISIDYTLDGKTVTAEELAGATGKLGIHFVVEKNDKADESFFDGYALQASFTLDTDKCTNIEADGATVANVGSDKQLSYTILPGKGIDTDITADVEDFEMAAATINAVKLKLDIEIDDEELLDKVHEIMDAADELNSGADELYDGTDKLKNGGSDLKSGAGDLYDGTASLNDGVDSLKSGVETIRQGLDSLNSKSSELTVASSQVMSALTAIQSALSGVSMNTDELAQLVNSSGQIKQAIDNLYSGATALQANLGFAQYKAALKQASGGQIDVDELLTANQTVLGSLNTQLEAIGQGIEQIKAILGYENREELNMQLSQLGSQAAQLTQLIQLITANTAAINGMDTYLGSFSEGMASLTAGLSQLKDSYEQFDAAINTLVARISSLVVNMSELSGAINTLTSEYGRLDSGIREYTDGVAQLAAGYMELVDGVDSLSEGSRQLLSGSLDLLDGTADLYDGIVELSDGVAELKDGTTEFYDKTRNMDGQIEDEIDDMIASMSGSDEPIVSFVSEKNSNVSSVQFVIKTAAIEKPEPVAEPEAEQEKLTFWQKLTNLFK